MKSKSPQEVRLVLTDHEGLGRISVDLEAFFSFSFLMAEELQNLVGKWKHVAPPSKRQRAPRPRHWQPPHRPE